MTKIKSTTSAVEVVAAAAKGYNRDHPCHRTTLKINGSSQMVGASPKLASRENFSHFRQIMRMLLSQCRNIYNHSSFNLTEMIRSDRNVAGWSGNTTIMKSMGEEPTGSGGDGGSATRESLGSKESNYKSSVKIPLYILYTFTTKTYFSYFLQ